MKTFCGQKFKTLFLTSSLAWIIAIILQLSDSIIAGQFLGEQAVAAINIVNPVDSFVMFLSNLFALGPAILYVKYVGQFNQKRANQFASEGFIVSCFCSILILCTCFIIRDPFLNFYGITDNIKQMAYDYFTWYIIVFSLSPIYVALENLVYNDGDEIVLNSCSITQVFGNIILSIVFVNFFGIAGVGMGTAVSFALGICILVSHFFRKKNSIKFTWYFKIKDIPTIIKYSLLDSCTFIFLTITNLVMNKFIIMEFGETFLPLLTIISFLQQLEMAFGGISNAMKPLANVYLAENNPERVKNIVRLSTRVALGISCTYTVIFFVISGFIPSIFNITTPEVCEAGIIIIRILCFECPFVALIYIYTTYYLVKNHVAIGVIISCLQLCVCILVFGTTFARMFGPVGLGIGYMLSPVICFPTMMLYVYLRYKKVSYPLLLSKPDKEIFNYDLTLNSEDISKTIEKINTKLSEKDASMRACNMISLLIEEICMSVIEHNEGKKILMEISVYLDDSSVQIIMWDTGEVFDITNEDNIPTDFRSFFVSSLMEQQKVKSHQTLIGFNRNAFKIDKN